MKTYIVTPDKHFPLHDKKAISVVCKAIKSIKPDGYIDLGDSGEWASASHWQWKRKNKPPLEYYLPEIIQEIEEVNKGMDLIDEALDKANVKEKHFITGNHDQWLEYFVDEYPYLDQYGLNKALKLEDRGYEVQPLGKLLEIGDMSYYHGHNYSGMNHASNHCRQYKQNIMYGHHHDVQQSSITHMDGQKSAWSIGCLKDMSDKENQWLGYRKTNWSHAFSIVDFFENGYFTVHVIQIIKGRTSLWGEIIDGNK